jgi:periodic tryptophan protein 1
MQQHLTCHAPPALQVRLWDLAGNHQQSVLALRHHSDKVQALAWHTTEQALLLTAAYDRKAAVVDVRSPGSARSWSLGATADPEAAAWDPHTEHQFAVSSEDGSVRCFDARKEGAPLWTLAAHKKAASSLDYNPSVAGILATGSADKTVKLWDVSGAAPALLATKDMDIGKVFSVKFSPDSATLLAAGGSKGKLGVWNTLEQEAMQARMPEAQAALDEEGRVLGGAVAGMGALDVNSSDEEDGEEGAGGLERMLGGGDAEGEEEDSEEEEEQARPPQPAAGSSSSSAARTAGARSAKMRAGAGRSKAKVRVKSKSRVGR